MDMGCQSRKYRRTIRPTQIWQTSTLFTRAERTNNDLSATCSTQSNAFKPKLFRRAQPWTPGEEKFLIELRGQQESWEEIAKRFPNRTYGALQAKYWTLTHDPANRKSKEWKVRKWSKEEEERLVELKDANASWEEIAKEFPNRALGSLKNKYNYLNRATSVPKTFSDRWTAEEDTYLLQLGKENIPWDEKNDPFQYPF